MAIYGLQLNLAERRIKVGTSTNPVARIAAQKHECVLFVVDGSPQTEAVCHALLAPYRRGRIGGRSEQFVVPDRILRTLRELPQRFSGLTDKQAAKLGYVPGLDIPVPGIDF